MLAGEPRLAPVSRLAWGEGWATRESRLAAWYCSRVGRAVCAGGRADGSTVSRLVGLPGGGRLTESAYSFEVIERWWATHRVAPTVSIIGVGEVVGDSQSRAYR